MTGALRPRPFGVLLVLVTLMAACGGDDASVSASAARSDAARSDAEPSEADLVVGPLADFGWDSYHALSADQDNLVFSPHSIAVALTMTRAGAAGDTAAGMDAVLHLEGIDDPHPSMNVLDRAIEAASGTVERPDGSTAELAVEIANALWAQNGLGFEEPFLDTLARNYGAGVRLVDYEDDPDGATEEINAWVAEETRERIDELLAPGLVTTATRLVLTNTVYLKAPWEHPFADGATTTEPFTRLDGSSTTGELMFVSDSFRYARSGDIQAIELPYVGGELAMLVLVPDEGVFDAAVGPLDGAAVEGIVGAMESTEVDLRLPAFEFTTRAGLAPVLRSLGMEAALDPDRADFSAMTTEAPLFVSDVVHEAFIAVDEAGTEAAAATAVVMDLTAAPAEPIRLTVDRAFVFVIRHIESGAPLFLGRVVDPGVG